MEGGRWVQESIGIFAYRIAYLLNNIPQGMTIFLEDRYNKKNKDKEEKTGGIPTTLAVINQK